MQDEVVIAAVNRAKAKHYKAVIIGIDPEYVEYVPYTAKEAVNKLSKAAAH